MAGKDPRQGRDPKEVKDYGYGEVTETTPFGVSTKIFTGPMGADGNSPYIKVPGRGAQG